MSKIKCEWCESVFDSEQNKYVCPSCGARVQKIQKVIKRDENNNQIKNRAQITQPKIKEKQKDENPLILLLKSFFSLILVSLVLFFILVVIVAVLVINNYDQNNSISNQISNQTSNQTIVEDNEKIMSHIYKINDGEIDLTNYNKLFLESIRIRPVENQFQIILQSIIKEDYSFDSLKFSVIDKNNNEYVLNNRGDSFEGNFIYNEDLLKNSYMGKVVFDLNFKEFDNLKNLKVSINNVDYYFDLVDYVYFQEKIKEEDISYYIGEKIKINNKGDEDLLINGITIGLNDSVYNIQLSIDLKWYRPRDDYSPIKYYLKNFDGKPYIPTIEFYLVNDKGTEYRLISDEYYSTYIGDIEVDNYWYEGGTKYLNYNFIGVDNNFKKLKVVVDGEEYFYNLSTQVDTTRNSNDGFSITYME